jgi:hypothetical protein
MEIEQRMEQAEDAIRTLNLHRLTAEGRAFVYQQAFQGLLKVAAPMPGVFESVGQALDVAATVAIHSGEPQHKVDVTDATCQEILSVMNQAVEASMKK